MIAHDLARAITRYERLYREMQPPMTLTQFIVMTHIEHGKTHKEAHLEEKTGLQQPVIRDVIHKLIRKKYLKRMSNDARGKKIAVTREGGDAYLRCEKIIGTVDTEFLSRLAHESATHFTAYLSGVTT